uniref:Peptidase M13 N-terminal domain-containing protein n=1 Tax=Parascaris univalens TaxID=6257 RepID=A0A915AD40_PARUN
MMRMKRCCSLLLIIGCSYTCALSIPQTNLLSTITPVATRNGREVNEVNNGENTSVRSDNDMSVIENAALSGSLNKSIDPCDDFYEFVCDGWMRKHPLTDSDAKLTQFRTDDLIITRKMRALLENRDRYFDGSHTAQLIFDMYDRCKNVDERMKVASKPIFELLAKMDRVSSLTDKLLEVKSISIFFRWFVDSDMKNATKNRIMLLPAYPDIGRPYFVLRKYGYVRRALSRYLRRVLSILVHDDIDQIFFKPLNDEVERRINSFFLLETAIAKILYYAKRHSDDNSAYYNLRSAAELQRLAPNIIWRRALWGIIPESMRGHIDLDTLLINVREPEIISKIDSLIGSVSEQALSDYLQWKVVLNREKYLDSRYRDAKIEFYHVLYGTSAAKSMWYSCVGRVLQSFPDIANRYYVKYFFDDSSRNAVRELIDNVRDAFSDLIWENTWMDTETKDAADRKVHSMLSFVGFHPKLFNRSALETNCIMAHHGIMPI